MCHYSALGIVYLDGDNVVKALMSAATKIAGILEPLEAEERRRVLLSVRALLGESSDAGNDDDDGNEDDKSDSSGAVGKDKGRASSTIKKGQEQSYWSKKDPTNRNEQLAIAAQFLESIGTTEIKKDDIANFFKAARHNFDSSNFKRDIDNARKNGLFNKGSGAQLVLSAFGQNYVAALPDREAVAALRKPKAAGGRRPAGKKAAKKAVKSSRAKA